MPINLRKRMFVDSKVQGVLLSRIALYWVLSMVAVALLSMWWNVVAGPLGQLADPFQIGGVWQQSVAIMVASLIMLPALLVDTISTTNRFVGPTLRVRQALRQIAQGETLKPVKFRRRDQWSPMADEVNAVVAYVESLKQQLAQAQADNAPSDDATTRELAEVGAY